MNVHEAVVKKSVFLIVAFAAIVMLAVAVPASAATGKDLKAGLTMSTFTGSDTEFFDVSPEYRMGFAFGGHLSHELSPTLSFQPEAYYAMKGAKYEEGGDSVETDLDDIKSLDFGLTFGAGVALETFSLEARYTMGLTSFDDSANPDDLKNSGFMFLVGIGL